MEWQLLFLLIVPASSIFKKNSAEASTDYIQNKEKGISRLLIETSIQDYTLS
jgi:hypothetical protein